MRCRIIDMRDKEVINLKDGCRLGYVGDVEFDTETGQLTALVIFGRNRFFGLFGREEDIVIKWNDIEVVGDDTILVCAESAFRPEKKQGRGFFQSIFK